jgi:HSP20 family molecular chaperone IbpA
MNSVAEKAPTAPSVPSQETNEPTYYLTPAVDITSSEEGYQLRAELPGVDKESLEITVNKGELTIVGRRKFPTSSGEALHREIRPYDYRRAYQLDSSIDTDKINARLDQGILTLTLPKAEAVKPLKIAIE